MERLDTLKEIMEELTLEMEKQNKKLEEVCERYKTSGVWSLQDEHELALSDGLRIALDIVAQHYEETLRKSQRERV